MHQYIPECRKALASIKFSKLIHYSDEKHKSKYLDLLWNMGYFFKLEQPQWSGFMQKHVTGNHPGKSTFSFLPIINLSPSDKSCIFSTLLFVKSQAKQIDIPNSCLTFDQPLYIKPLR